MLRLQVSESRQSELEQKLIEREVQALQLYDTFRQTEDGEFYYMIEACAERFIEILNKPRHRAVNLLGFFDEYFGDLKEEGSAHSKLMYKYVAGMAGLLWLDFPGINLATDCIAASLHDIGKPPLPKQIREKLTQDNYVFSSGEYQVVKTHSIIGYLILSKVAEALPEFDQVPTIVLGHHELWDGTGYPLGLKQEEIHPVSRTITVADAYLAISRKRGYDPETAPDQAIHELRRCSGGDYNAQILIGCNNGKLAQWRDDPNYERNLRERINRNARYGVCGGVDISSLDTATIEVLEMAYRQVRIIQESQFDPRVVQAFERLAEKHPEMLKS